MNRHREIKNAIDHLRVRTLDKHPDRYLVGHQAFNLMARHCVFDTIQQGDNKDRFRGLEVTPITRMPPFQVALVDQHGITLEWTTI